MQIIQIIQIMQIVQIMQIRNVSPLKGLELDVGIDYLLDMCTFWTQIT